MMLQRCITFYPIAEYSLSVGFKGIMIHIIDEIIELETRER